MFKNKKNSIRKWEVKRTPKDKILSHVYWRVILVGENWGHFYCCRHKNKLVHFRDYHCILMRVLDILLVHLVFLSCSALIFHARKDSVYTFILFSFFSMLLLYSTSVGSYLFVRMPNVYGLDWHRRDNVGSKKWYLYYMMWHRTFCMENQIKWCYELRVKLSL